MDNYFILCVRPDNRSNAVQECDARMLGNVPQPGI